MFFSEVIGQDIVKEKLLLSVQKNQVSHAQLFLGPEGSGSLPLAIAYAQYINCENKQEHDSCGKCASCIKAQKMIHPDIHFSFPVFKLKPGSEHPALSSDFIKQWREAVLKNPYQNINDWLEFVDAENKQGAISAEECRAIIHNLNMKTYESRYKVTIIWRPEFFSAGGKMGNILLKLLEEPPPNTVMLLIAENRDELLATILSRCQIISIPRLSDEEILSTLMNKDGLTRDVAHKVVRQSEGNYREAMQVIANADDDLFEYLRKWMQILISGKPSSSSAELVKWIDEAARLGREKQKNFFRYTLEFFRECMLFQKTGEAHSRLHDEEKRMGLWLSARLGDNDWQQLQQWFEEAHYHIERNAHPKILFMHLSLQVQKLISNKKLILAA